MRICRFNRDRMGVIQDDQVFDITDLYDMQPTWPLPQGDWIIRQMPDVMPQIARRLDKQNGIPLDSIRLECPVTNPGKLVGAPVNYSSHIAEAAEDANFTRGKEILQIDDYGLFLKANSALSGPSDSVKLRLPERRNDHEVELAVIIGKEASDVTRENALDYVFGYTIGIDMTMRGPEWPVSRKSAETYAVLGPWIVTADEVPDPNNLTLGLKVNGESRQLSNTKHMIFDVPRLIEYGSQFFSFLPGDVIYTGTPEGVSPVQAGDVMDAYIEGIGEMRIGIA